MPHPTREPKSSIDHPPQRVRLLEADPDWLTGLDPDVAPMASRQLTLPASSVPTGANFEARGTHVLLSGALLRNVAFAGRTSTQVLGPGDVVDVEPVGGDSGLSLPVTLEVVQYASLARLDSTFARASRLWPSLNDVLLSRLVAQERRAVLQLAITSLPRVEQRLLAILWHLAERFGRMTGEGAVLDLQLHHHVLGRLIGAARPTVSLAAKELDARGAARRSAGRRWTLPREARALLDAPWTESATPARTSATARAFVDEAKSYTAQAAARKAAMEHMGREAGERTRRQATEREIDGRPRV